MKTRKAYSYIRISTNLQLKGDGIRRQEEASKKYALDNKLELVESINGISLKDVGVSAFKGKNALLGVLATFISALDSGKIEKGSVLILESLDRLSREKLSEALELFLKIIRNNIEIVTLSDNQKYTTKIINDQPYALHTGISVMIRANEESEIKSKRLSASWNNKRNNLQTKVLTKTCPAWMKYDEDTKKFFIVPERGEVVKKIFDMCINTCGLYSIARHLNETNTPQFGEGKIWYVSYVKKILQNRSVIGEFSPHHYVDGTRQKIGDPIADYFPKIIDEQTFLLAQVAISKRTVLGKGRKGTNFTNLFSRLVRCGQCNSGVILKTHNSSSKSGRYFTCANKNVSGGCKLPSWNLSEFEGMIFKHLREIKFSDLIGISSSQNKITLDDQMSALISKKTIKEEDLDRAIDFSTKTELTELAKKKYVTKVNFLSEEIIQLDSDINEIKKVLNEQTSTEQFFSANEIKLLIDKIESTQNDYYFRSTLNQLLTKLIDKIELLYDQNHLKPWEFDSDQDHDYLDDTNPEEDSVFIAFRKTFKIRSTLTRDEIIIHPDFDLFNRNYNRYVRITYKTGVMREIYSGSDSSFVHKVKNLL